MRVPFSMATQLMIIRRATDMSGHTWCEQCGRECMTRADYEIDHCVPEGLQPDDDRQKLTADDGKLLCLNCHDKKTKRDVFEIAKAKRIDKKHRIVGAGRTELARRFGVKQEPR